MASFVEQAQRNLAELGFYKGPINGTIDAGTRTAITTYQTSVGLPQSGELSEATLSNLQVDIAKKRAPAIQVPQLKLVKQEPIPDFYNRELKALPAPRGDQDNARVPEFAGRIPSGPQVPRYTADRMVPPNLAPRTPTTWLNGAPDGGWTLGHTAALAAAALLLGWWWSSRKGAGSPIIEDGIDGADDDTESDESADDTE